MHRHLIQQHKEHQENLYIRNMFLSGINKIRIKIKKEGRKNKKERKQSRQ